MSQMKMNEFHDEYAIIINDAAHRYNLFTYYTHVKNQIKVLNEIGFLKITKIFKENGNELTDLNGDSSDSTWLYFVIEK